MKFNRLLRDELLYLATKYPIVTVTGPRQSGKTTLCRECFPNKQYVNLETPDTRDFASSDPQPLHLRDVEVPDQSASKRPSQTPQNPSLINTS
jgi:predicted AAA+ superfamily ATPase